MKKSLQGMLAQSISVRDMTASIVLIIFLVSILVISIGAQHKGRHAYPCYCKKCQVATNGEVVSQPAPEESNYWLNLFLFIVIILIVVVGVMAVMKKK